MSQAPIEAPGQDRGPLFAMLAQMADALSEEARHAQGAASWIRLRNGRRLRAGLDRILYCFDAESDVWFPPGMTAELAAGSHGDADEPVVVEVLEVRAQSVWLESPEDFGGSVPFARLRSNPWYLLDALRTRIDELRGEGGEGEEPPSAEDLRLVSCLLGLTEPRTNQENDQENGPTAAEVAAGYGDELPANDSQLEAVAACLSSDLRFVWGPPGTGKTETLGLLAAEAYLRGESVLVLAHSNAAVDAASIAVVRNLMRVHADRDVKNKGEALRAGDPFLLEAQDLPVTERAVLGRTRPDLVSRLEKLEGKGGELMDRQDSLFGGGSPAPETPAAALQRRAGRELAKVTDDLRKVRDQIGRAQKDLLDDAQLVLATLSKAAITPEIYQRRFDRILVDEASMAQPPQVVLAASLATRGPNGSLAVFGDFRQLAPVVQSWSRPVKQWLGRDVFELNGLVANVDTTPLLSVLSIQYRMHPKIMALVNGPSYGGRLRAGPDVEASTTRLAGYRPAAGAPVAWIDTGEFGARAHTTASHSRINPLSAWLSLQVALQMLEDGLEGIGVVTPYREQARLLRLLVRAAGVQAQVHTGTIHRFQGGERDAIILDLVDAAPQPPGVLFRNDDGLRLLNVAITRARGKLVCLSDGSYLKRSTSSASPAWAILANLCREARPLDPASVIDAARSDAGWAVMKPCADTSTLLEHDVAASPEVIAFEAGLPAWAMGTLRERPDVARRRENGSRLILLGAQAWLFPKEEPWGLRLADPQVVKLLMETVGTPPAAGMSSAGSGRPGTRVVPGSATAEPRHPTGASPLGNCPACQQALTLASDPGSQLTRVRCPACGANDRDAEPADLTQVARAQSVRCTCGSEMRGRRGPTGLFLGCSSFPTCRNTRPVRSLMAVPRPA